MNRRSLFLCLAAGLAFAVLFAVSTPAQAGVITVLADSGGSSADMLGTAGGAMVTSDAYSDTITSHHPESPVSIPLTFGITITSSGGVIESFSGEKAIGFGMGNQAIIDFSGTVGSASAGFVLLSGTITKLVENDLAFGGNSYDFSKLLGGPINITLTTTSGNLAGTLNNAGASVIGAGFGLQQSTPTSTPEPASLALLGIGMTGFLALRRFFKKTSVA